MDLEECQQQLQQNVKGKPCKANTAGPVTAHCTFEWELLDIYYWS
jgi:hypothetical protein